VSHDAPHGSDHAQGSDHVRKPPGSIGITGGVLLLVLGAILLSIMQGSFVAGSSPWGRVWPSIDSTKIPLPPKTI